MLESELCNSFIRTTCMVISNSDLTIYFLFNVSKFFIFMLKHYDISYLSYVPLLSYDIKLQKVGRDLCVISEQSSTLHLK